MREDLREMLWFAAGLILAYWGIQFTSFLWSMAGIVAKALIADAILP